MPGRGRGRPRKSVLVANADEATAEEAPQQVSKQAPGQAPEREAPRRRGRPRKNAPESKPEERLAPAPEQEPEQKTPRRRGRPKKIVSEPKTEPLVDDDEKPSPRPRGRPRKSDANTPSGGSDIAAPRQSSSHSNSNTSDANIIASPSVPASSAAVDNVMRPTPRRGRPRKYPLPHLESASPASPTPPAEQQTPGSRRRGRPRKIQIPASAAQKSDIKDNAAVSEEAGPSSETKPASDKIKPTPRRGRSKKITASNVDNSPSTSSPVVAAVKPYTSRPRGRPRKSTGKKSPGRPKKVAFSKDKNSSNDNEAEDDAEDDARDDIEEEAENLTDDNTTDRDNRSTNRENADVADMSSRPTDQGASKPFNLSDCTGVYVLEDAKNPGVEVGTVDISIAVDGNDILAASFCFGHETKITMRLAVSKSKLDRFICKQEEEEYREFIDSDSASGPASVNALGKRKAPATSTGNGGPAKKQVKLSGPPRLHFTYRGRYKDNIVPQLKLGYLDFDDDQYKSFAMTAPLYDGDAVNFVGIFFGVTAGQPGRWNDYSEAAAKTKKARLSN
ncbi:hypothetical protein B0T26DRAFT_674828 [Lasiosphaeria miniovina]|uniref:Uncharacterized protein n=1 Tax=Lasiosphaeria miniovina TaxID=1954250 RepID=A0AA40E404_9PEZI|nr:uncharacterized protein B0T26DRAFT_674828 [Lasiosphaeria miniovina]KAK0723231.1 hypothetical protein B0T26DRAFT_674828 [Lasiosphaeria miniovina]